MLEDGKTIDTSQSMIAALVSGQDDQFEEAFARFCINYHAIIKKWCEASCKSDEASDLTQKLILKLRKDLKKYTPQSDTKFRNWLRKVCANATLDMFRHKSREPLVFVDTAGFDAIADPNPQLIFHAFIDDERRQFVGDLICALRESIGPSDLAVLDAYLQSKPTSEIATSLGKNANAIHAALFRIRKKATVIFNRLLKKHPGLEISDLFGNG